IGDGAGLLGDLVGGAEPFRAGGIGRLALRLGLGRIVQAEHGILESVLYGREGQRGWIVLGGRILRHTLYNSRVDMSATRRISGVVMTHQPFPGLKPFRNNSMQMPALPLQPSPPRAGSNPIHTFNFMQTERFLTQRLIFGWETLRNGRSNQGEDVA